MLKVVEEILEAVLPAFTDLCSGSQHVEILVFEKLSFGHVRYVAIGETFMKATCSPRSIKGIGVTINIAVLPL
jgi:hypothetical protein